MDPGWAAEAADRRKEEEGGGVTRSSGRNGRNDLNKLHIRDHQGRGSGGAGSLPSIDQTTYYVFEPGLATTPLLAVRDEGRPMVRKELVILLSTLVHAWRGHFIVCAWIYWEEERHAYDRTDGSVVDEALVTWRKTQMEVTSGSKHVIK